MPHAPSCPDGAATARRDRVRARAEAIYARATRRGRDDPGQDPVRSWAHALERAERAIRIEDRGRAASAAAGARARAAIAARPPSPEWWAAWGALRDHECRDALTGRDWDEHARLRAALAAADPGG